MSKFTFSQKAQEINSEMILTVQSFICSFLHLSVFLFCFVIVLTIEQFVNSLYYILYWYFVLIFVLVYILKDIFVTNKKSVAKIAMNMKFVVNI